MGSSSEAVYCGHLWECCGYNRVITISNYNVTSLAFGNNHCLFLTTDNKVLSFGHNECGQLATGDKVDHLKDPHEITTLPSNVAAITCGAYTSAALTSDGVLFMWGKNEELQCGIENVESVLVPTEVKLVDKSRCQHIEMNSNIQNKIIKVSCGYSHTMALTGFYDIWVWGSGLQLGIPGVNKSAPTVITALKNRKALSVSSGFDYSLVVLAVENAFDSEDQDCSKSNSICYQCRVASQSSDDNLCPLGLQRDTNSSQDLCNGSINNSLSETCAEEETEFYDSTDIISSESNIEEGSEVHVDAETLQLNNENSVSQLHEIGQLTEEKHESTARKLSLDLNTTDPLNSAGNLNLNDGCYDKTNYDEMEGVELRDIHSTNKRTSSFIDRQMAKEYLEKLTENADSISISHDRHDIPLHLPMNKRKMQDQTDISSNESFEVVETNLIDTDTADNSSGSYCTYLKRSGSLKSLLELNQVHKVKEKNRKNSIEALVTVSRKRINKKRNKKSSKRQEADRCIQTEVWSWGNGNNGQLGHGDQMDREAPCCMQQLSGQGVVRVLAGKGHSIALTADNRVFSWGLNSKGQLGHSFKSDSSLIPKTIELPNNELIWDIATGDSHTLLLADHKAPRVSIYYCGGHEIKIGESCICPKERGIHQLNILKKSGLISKVFAGGPSSGCIVNLQGLSELPVFHEFAATERQFLYQLRVMLTKVLRPLLNEGMVTRLPDLYSDPLQKIIAKLTTIADMVAVNSYDLTMVVMTGGHLDSIYIADIPDEWLEIFLSYGQLLCDAISVNAAAELAKEWSWTPNHLRMLVRNVLADAAIEKKSSAEIFIYLLSTPIRRAKDYARLFNRISSTNLMRVQDVDVQDLYNKWQRLVDILISDILSAEGTKLFWDTAPNKIVENYRKCSRRLIRDSKIHQIQLQSSGRFSSHWFILFNDILLHHHFSSTQSCPLQTIWVEPLPDSENCMNSFLLRMPEDVLTLFCSSSAEKTKWISALNSSIRSLLDFEKDPHYRMKSLSSGDSNFRLLPPLPRYASYTFTKLQPFKDASYKGMWLCGKVHGQGEMVWSDNRKYVGKFKQNLIQGEGVMTIPSADREFHLEGLWKDSKLNGHGCVRYPNGDVYEGTLKDHQRHGHGMLKQGQFLMSAASVYVGQWNQDQRHGYGVLDDIRNGEKYMGMWQEDAKHGKGLVVTIDGIYYEGNFFNDKLQGFGAMMFEDGTFYEGDLGQCGTLNGKGTLYLSNGDHIDGTFNGVWSDGIKINGIYHKSTSISSAKDVMMAEGNLKKWTYGELCVPAKSKWVQLFALCKESLGIHDVHTVQDNKRAWEAVAVAVAKHKKETRHRRRLHHYQVENLDLLERIPHTGTAKGTLTLEEYREMQQYLSKAFECPFHPLGLLVENIVDVYRAAYLGVGAHPRLLRHAVAEVRMFLSRIYGIVRTFFPDLPPEETIINVRHSSKECDADADDDSLDFDFEDPDIDIVSKNELLHPLLLPRIYPPLFTLYALYNEKEDDQYWKRLLKWNRQPDVALMAFLGVSQKFWSAQVQIEILEDKTKSISTIKEMMFAQAVEMLQHISTEFSPREKLKIIHLCFKRINDEVQMTFTNTDKSKEEFMWSMDELFPVFQFVVVRARIRHLGSEIHLIDDLMEKHFEMGELGIMFTTLKACYFQIRTEKAQC